MGLCSFFCSSFIRSYFTFNVAPKSAYKLSNVIDFVTSLFVMLALCLKASTKVL